MLLLHIKNILKLQNFANQGLSNLNVVKRSYFLSVHIEGPFSLMWKQLSHPDFRSPRIIFSCYQTSIVVSGIPGGLLCSVVVLLIGLVWDDHRGLSRKTFCIQSTLWIKRFPLSIPPLCVIVMHQKLFAVMSVNDVLCHDQVTHIWIQSSLFSEYSLKYGQIVRE